MLFNIKSKLPNYLPEQGKGEKMKALPKIDQKIPIMS